VLSDVEMAVTVDSGWHPSHLETFDVHSKQTRIVLFRHNRDCMMSTNLTLTADKQVSLGYCKHPYCICLSDVCRHNFCKKVLSDFDETCMGCLDGD